MYQREIERRLLQTLHTCEDRGCRLRFRQAISDRKPTHSESVLFSRIVRRLCRDGYIECDSRSSARQTVLWRARITIAGIGYLDQLSREGKSPEPAGINASLALPIHEKAEQTAEPETPQARFLYVIEIVTDRFAALKIGVSIDPRDRLAAIWRDIERKTDCTVHALRCHAIYKAGKPFRLEADCQQHLKLLGHQVHFSDAWTGHTEAFDPGSLDAAIDFLNQTDAERIRPDELIDNRGPIPTAVNPNPPIPGRNPENN
ncbi:MAG: hypothetical protein NXI04_22045 [Planctomycetaceae bacterium]|nr:hypothetical protein [Planctomycetaceae bacterium]